MVWNLGTLGGLYDPKYSFSPSWYDPQSSRGRKSLTYKLLKEPDTVGPSSKEWNLNETLPTI